MGYKLNGSHLPLDVAFTDSNGTQYPSNWLRGSTAAQRAAVPTGGITWVEPTQTYFNKKFYTEKGVGKPLADIPIYNSYDEKGVGIGDPIRHDPGLKTEWVQKQKDEADQLLSPTDWMVVRQAEGGTSIPSANKTYRAAVRTQCGLREATINACSDVDKLCATVNGELAPTVAGTGSNGASEKKKEDGSSYDPVQYNDIANPDLLEDWPTPI